MAQQYNPMSSSNGIISAAAASADPHNLRAPDIFSYENSKNFATNVGVRCGTWLEGIVAHIQGTNKIRLAPNEKTPQRLVSIIQNDLQLHNDYLSKLELVQTWNRDTLRKEIEIISSSCPFIRKMYEMLVKTYVQCYFYNYPNLSFDITVPSLSVFLSAFYKAFACDSSVRSMDFFSLHGSQRDAIIMDAIRQALFVVTREAMTVIFDKLNTASINNNVTPAAATHGNTLVAAAAGPMSVASSKVTIPPTVDTLKTSHANAAFRNDVQQCVDYAETPMSKINASAKQNNVSSNQQYVQTPSTKNKQQQPASNSNAAGGAPTVELISAKENNQIPAAAAAVAAVTPIVSGNDNDVKTHRTIVMDTPQTNPSSSHYRGHRSGRGDKEIPPSRSHHRRSSEYDHDDSNSSDDSGSSSNSDDGNSSDDGDRRYNSYHRNNYRDNRRHHHDYYRKRNPDDQYYSSSKKHHSSNRSDIPPPSRSNSRR